MKRSERVIYNIFKDNPHETFCQQQISKRSGYSQGSISQAIIELQKKRMIAESHREQLSERGPGTLFYKLAAAPMRQIEEQIQPVLLPPSETITEDIYIYAPSVHQAVVEVRALYEMITPYDGVE